MQPPYCVLSWLAGMTCVASGVALTGQYGNVATVIGYPPHDPPVEDTDASHYFGLVTAPPP